MTRAWNYVKEIFPKYEKIICKYYEATFFMQFSRNK